jgi:hypothetical protein
MTQPEVTVPLAVQAARLYDANDNDALFRLATLNWPPLGVELPPGIGEVCRYAFIRSVQMNQIDQHLWRARAMTAAVMSGARDTAAGLLLQAFFVAMAITVRREQSGYEHGFEQARMILDEMTRLLPADAPRWSELFARLYHDKRAFAWLMEGSGGGRPAPEGLGMLDEAEAEYRRAEALAEGQNERGALKVRGGLALVRYLRLAIEPGADSVKAMRRLAEETRTIAASAREAGYRDVEDWAVINADVMERGEFVGWTSYEVV